MNDLDLSKKKKKDIEIKETKQMWNYRHVFFFSKFVIKEIYFKRVLTSLKKAKKEKKSLPSPFIVSACFFGRDKQMTGLTLKSPFFFLRYARTRTQKKTGGIWYTTTQ